MKFNRQEKVMLIIFIVVTVFFMVLTAVITYLNMFNCTYLPMAILMVIEYSAIIVITLITEVQFNFALKKRRNMIWQQKKYFIIVVMIMIIGIFP